MWFGQIGYKTNLKIELNPCGAVCEETNPIIFSVIRSFGLVSAGELFHSKVLHRNTDKTGLQGCSTIRLANVKLKKNLLLEIKT